VQTIANAMDVGHPSNFERMLWLYHSDRQAMQQDIVGSRHADADVRTAIRRVYETHGYLLDPHSAIAYLGLKQLAGEWHSGRVGIFLATAHPAKFSEVVEPVIGREVETPGPLADALAKPRHILKISATFDAVRRTLES
jgi:threonine synthase